MVARGHAGIELDYPEHRALVDRGADLLADRVGERVVADREAFVGRPELDVFGAGPRDFSGGADLVDLDLGFALAVVAGDDAPDIKRHTSSLWCGLSGALAPGGC